MCEQTEQFHLLPEDLKFDSCQTTFITTRWRSLCCFLTSQLLTY